MIMAVRQLFILVLTCGYLHATDEIHWAQTPGISPLVVCSGEGVVLNWTLREQDDVRKSVISDPVRGEVYLMLKNGAELRGRENVQRLGHVGMIVHNITTDMTGVLQHTVHFRNGSTVQDAASIIVIDKTHPYCSNPCTAESYHIVAVSMLMMFLALSIFGIVIHKQILEKGKPTALVKQLQRVEEVSAIEKETKNLTSERNGRVTFELKE